MAGKCTHYFMWWCALIEIMPATCTFKLQTWDLLRVMYNGFVGLCTDFIAENPGYFIIPVRVNGSAVESYFSQLKFSADGQLSASNYATAQASVETTKATSTKRPRESDYRDAGIDIHPVQLKKHKYKT